MMMCGTRATLVLNADADLSETDVKQALEAQGLKFASFEQREIDRPGAVYVAKTPKST